MDAAGPTIRVFGAEQVAQALDYAGLADALADGFRVGAEGLPRTLHAVDGGWLAFMPAWGRAHGAVKLATFLPDNPQRCGRPAIQAQVLLFDVATGTPLALVEGGELTVRRTAAVSALAARFLSRPDAGRLLVMGAGALAPHMALAHAAVRPIKTVRVWARDPVKAATAVARIAAERPDLHVTVTTDLPAEAAEADIVSCATSAHEPVLLGRWLRPGCHVDLVGNFSPDGRECDDDAVIRSRVFVDTRQGALAEAGELLIPMAAGALRRDAIQGDLAELCRGEVQGRGSESEITLFKSVGAAVEDLIAAERVLAWADEGGR